MQTKTGMNISRKKILKRVLVAVGLAVLLYIVRYAWVSFPIMSGFTAKNMCSCVFVAGRTESSVAAEELSDFPLSLANYSVDHAAGTVTSTVLGMAKKKAIYRKGFGCTLVNGLDEETIRSQPGGSPLIAVADTSMQLVLSSNKDVDQPALSTILQQHVAQTNAKGLHEARAVVVLYDGQLLGEHYAPGFDKNSRMLGWSMAKSITSALVGLLVQQGRLDVNKRAPVPEWADANDKRHAITLQHLLQQSSGLDFEEDYSKYSDATRMLFGRADMAAYAASRPLKLAPGTQFYYSSGNSNILSRIIRNTVGEQNYHSFIYDSLFKKAGMYSALMEPDASGTMVGSSYVFARARDWAKFGLLYYNKGVVNGQKLFTYDWVQQTVKPSSADDLQQYGYQFWLNGFDKDNPSQRKFPSAPADMFYAGGYAGQNVFIIPSKKLVIVRLGFKTYDGNALLGDILKCVR